MKKNMTIIISLLLSPILQDKNKYKYKKYMDKKIRNLNINLHLKPFVTLITSFDKSIHTHLYHSVV